jgi:hypothetical protein
MSASDHLNPDQFFMPMDKLLKMPSDDAEPTSRAQSVEAVNRERGTTHYMERYPQDYAELRQSMVEHGHTEPLPLSRNKYGVVKLANGHHRVEIARQLGWEGMHVYHEPDYDEFGGGK